MKCSGCVAAVAKELDTLPGVQEWSADVTSSDKLLFVTGDVQEEQVVAAVAKAGFTAELLA